MKILVWLFIGLDHHETSEHLLCDIVKQLCLNGHSVHIIQKKTGGSLPGIPQCLANYNVTTDQVPCHLVNKKNLIARYLTELNYINSCRRFFKSDFDAVFIQSTTVLGLAVRVVKRHIPLARITINVQDIFPYNLAFSNRIKRNGFLFKSLAYIQRYAYRNATRIITISEDMKETLVEDGTNPDKVDVIYNWSYQDDLYDIHDTARVSAIIRKEYFNVVYAGNIGVMQNVDICIEAANLMKNDKTVWFHIIGNGVYKNRLKQKAEEYGITNISFSPMQAPEFAPYVYSAADINVIPLAPNGYRTALPSKTATCFACQKPVIFAIGKESMFATRVMRETMCPVISSNSPEDLVKSIELIKKGMINPRTAEFYTKWMKKTVNSLQYANIIMGNSPQ